MVVQKTSVLRNLLKNHKKSLRQKDSKDSMISSLSELSTVKSVEWKLGLKN